MGGINRREAVRLAAGFVAGTGIGAFATRPSFGQAQPEKLPAAASQAEPKVLPAAQAKSKAAAKPQAKASASKAKPPSSDDPTRYGAIDNPSSYMLGNRVTVELPPGHRGHRLAILSAVKRSENPLEVGMLSGKMIVFRADPSQDDFTANGGVYWRIGQTDGRVQLKNEQGFLDTNRGLLVMAVRQPDGDTVDFYTMQIDLRC